MKHGFLLFTFLLIVSAPVLAQAGVIEGPLRVVAALEIHSATEQP